MTERLKKIKWKNKVYRDYLKNGKTKEYCMNVQHAITEVSKFTSERKDKYYDKLAMKLNDTKSGSKM